MKSDNATSCDAATSARRTIRQCRNCQGELDLPAPEEHRPVVVRACIYCCSKYYVADEETSGPRPGESAHWVLSTSDLPTHGPSALRRFIAQSAAGVGPAQGLLLAVTATPLDERLVPLAPAVGGVVSDLSAHGARVVVPTDRHASFWLVDFAPAGMPGVQLAIRCETAAPVSGGAWRIAGSIG